MHWIITGVRYSSGSYYPPQRAAPVLLNNLKTPSSTNPWPRIKAHHVDQHPSPSARAPPPVHDPAPVQCLSDSRVERKAIHKVRSVRKWDVRIRATSRVEAEDLCEERKMARRMDPTTFRAASCLSEKRRQCCRDADKRSRYPDRLYLATTSTTSRSIDEGLLGSTGGPSSRKSARATSRGTGLGSMSDLQLGAPVLEENSREKDLQIADSELPPSTRLLQGTRYHVDLPATFPYPARPSSSRIVSLVCHVTNTGTLETFQTVSPTLRSNPSPHATSSQSATRPLELPLGIVTVPSILRLFQ
ncbi:hypothetical protein B0H13DRAFT_2335581 [Mycena leptocephala]|nr:hypothetical protein B0H13DRAFT_2335581 [Mycena leptocephala]